MGVREVFDESARDFDRNRRNLIPCFDEFYGGALDTITHPTEHPLRILDLGAGTGLLSLFLARRFPEARLRLVDVSPEMLEVARERFADERHRFEFEVADFSRGFELHTWDVVASALAIHHLSAEEKRELFRIVHEQLAPGGVFVNADQMAGATAEEDASNREEWLAAVRETGTSHEEIRVALERMSEDQPSSLADQLRWLREAGFQHVSSPVDRGMFAVLHARKAG